MSDAFRVARTARARAFAPTRAALFLTLALAPTLAGCALFDRRWPEAGGGGFGELEDVVDPRAQAFEARLPEFDARGARRFAAGEYDEASLLFTRVRRELVAGHEEDAGLNMDRLDELIARIENRLRSARK
jgi:hypothetical protein